MVAIGAALVVLSLSILATRLGALALEATGLSTQSASFQARSAFTGVGFTTPEAESITHHPARRRVVSLLMLYGNAGFVSIIASVVLGFAGVGAGEAARRLGVLVGGLLLLIMLVRSHRCSMVLTRMLERLMSGWTELDARDYAQLLRISGGFAIREAHVRTGGWLAGRRLGDLALPEEGVLLLGIRRLDGSYVGVPGPDTELSAGDVVVLYGHRDRLDDMVRRPSGIAGESQRDQSARAHEQQREAEETRDAQRRRRS